MPDHVPQPAGDFESGEAQRLARTGNWRYELETGAVQWSKALYDIFGIDPSAPAPSYAEHTTIYSPESFMRLDTAVANAISTGTPYTLDLEIRHASGEPRWITARGEAIRDTAGRIVALRGTASDITERQLLLNALAERERALQFSEQRFRASFNSMFQLMAILAPDGTLLEVNEPALAFIGGPASDQLGKRFWDTDWWQVSEAVRDGVRDAVARAASGEFVRYDVELANTRQQRMVVDFSIKPVRDDTGKVVLLVPEGRDVTEERRTRAALENSENRFRLAMKNAPIGEALVSPDGHWFSVNEALCTMLGYTEAELLNKTLQDITHPDDLVRELELQQELIAGSRDRFQMEKRHYRADGSIVRVQLDVSLLRDAEGQPLHFISQKQDITVRRQLEAQQEALNQRLTLALHASGIGVWEWDLSTNLLTWDSALRRIYGVGADEQIDYRFWRNAVVADDLPRAEVTLQDALREKRRGATEFRIVHPKLGVRFIESLFGLVLDNSGQPTRMIGVNLDVTERWLAEKRLNESNRLLEHRIVEVSELQEQLREQAIRDGLTGLYNRRYFDERLASELARAARDGQGVSLIMADLDHFKTINDRFGHPGGDALLQAWSELLRNNLRASDVLCRFGGEEFVVVLPGSSEADAETRAEQLRSRFEALTLPAANGIGSIGTTVSIGVAHAAAGSRTAEQLVRAADAALYSAKTKGRNRVICETPSALSP